MNCERWEPMLSMYLDGELSASDVSRLEGHLEVCESCREELASFEELSSVLATHAEPDPFFLTRFRARRDEELGPEGTLQVWRRLAVRLLPLAAAALIGAAAAVWVSTEDDELVELEARQLGDGFLMAVEEDPYPVLNIALEPFPGGER
jgi:anti-sigma factor RsiW